MEQRTSAGSNSNSPSRASKKSEKSQRSGFDYLTGSASALAQQLALRRKIASSHEDDESESLENNESGSELRKSKTQVLEMEPFMDLVELLRQDMMTECDSLNTKFEELISRFDDCFNSWQDLVKDTVSEIRVAKSIVCCNLEGSPSNIGAEFEQGRHKTGIKMSIPVPIKPRRMPTENFVAGSTTQGTPRTPRETTVMRSEDFTSSGAYSSTSHATSRKSPSVLGNIGNIGSLRSSLASESGRSVMSFQTQSFRTLLPRGRNRGRIAQLIWLYLEDPRLVPSGKLYVWLTVFVVLASCCLSVLQTGETPPFNQFIESLWQCIVDSIMTLEIMVRLLVCPNRFSFWIDGHNVVDLFNGPLALLIRVALPVLFPDDDSSEHRATMFLTSGLLVVRLLKLLRYFEGSHLIYTAFQRAFEALPVLLYVLIVYIATFASIIYTIEPRHNIASLPEAWWFTVVTLSTVGYGQVVPVTAECKCVVCILIILSALYMALPLGIVGKVFAEVWDQRRPLLLTQLARRRFRAVGYTAKDIPAMLLSFDKDEDGLLSMEEFIDMVRDMQFDITIEQAVELFKVFDADGGGTIDDQEFLETLFPKSAVEIYGQSNSETDGQSQHDGGTTSIQSTDA